MFQRALTFPGHIHSLCPAECHPGSSLIKPATTGSPVPLTCSALDCALKKRMEKWSLPSRNLPCDPHGLFKEEISWDPLEEGHQSALGTTQGERTFLGRKSSIRRNPGARGHSQPPVHFSFSLGPPSLSHLHSWGFSCLVFSLHYPPSPPLTPPYPHHPPPLLSAPCCKGMKSLPQG